MREASHEMKDLHRWIFMMAGQNLQYGDEADGDEADVLVSRP